MSKKMKLWIACLFGTALILCGAQANATYMVQVGYADNLRPTPFFPMPWQGDPFVDTFAGNAASIDAAAVRVINTGITTIIFNGLTVDSFGDGASFNLWNGYIGASILAGHSMIFTQTASYNFDSSDDQGSNIFAIPRVRLNIDGISQDFFDTAQVLNTEGTDHLALAGLNESHQWREIGTYGGQAAVPEPATIALFGLGLLGFVATRRRQQ